MTAPGENTLRLRYNAAIADPAHARSLVLDRGPGTSLPQALLQNGRIVQTLTPQSGRLAEMALDRNFHAACIIECIDLPRADLPEYTAVRSSREHCTNRVRLIIIREMGAPCRARVRIFWDQGTGQLDYQTPITRYPLKLWTAWQDKGGFGMSRFGHCDFGFDSAAAPGFGRGRFGFGEHGWDAFAFEWISPELASGTHRFAVEVEDRRGQTHRIETQNIEIEPK